MTHKLFLPLLERLLVHLKTTTTTVLLLGAFVLAPAPMAHAQLTFSIDTFNTDTLRITLPTGYALAGSTPTTESNWLFLTDNDNVSNGSWILTSTGGSVIADGLLGSASMANLRVSSGGSGDDVGWTFNAELVSGATLSSPLTIEFNSSGAFNPSSVSNFALWWGNPLGGTGAVKQSFGSAVEGGGSAVPEPATYAALLGLGVLGFAANRRLRKH